MMLRTKKIVNVCKNIFLFSLFATLTQAMEIDNWKREAIKKAIETKDVVELTDYLEMLFDLEDKDQLNRHAKEFIGIALKRNDKEICNLLQSLFDDPKNLEIEPCYRDKVMARIEESIRNQDAYIDICLSLLDLSELCSLSEEYVYVKETDIEDATNYEEGSTVHVAKKEELYSNAGSLKTPTNSTSSVWQEMRPSRGRELPRAANANPKFKNYVISSRENLPKK